MRKKEEMKNELEVLKGILGYFTAHPSHSRRLTSMRIGFIYVFIYFSRPRSGIFLFGRSAYILKRLAILRKARSLTPSAYAYDPHAQIRVDGNRLSFLWPVALPRGLQNSPHRAVIVKRQNAHPSKSENGPKSCWRAQE